MKSIISIILLACSMVLAMPSNAYSNRVQKSVEQKKEVTVYITKTGSKYHRGDCSYLRKSKISISKKNAVANGYGACSRCRP